MPYTLAFQTSAKELPFSTPAQVIKDSPRKRASRVSALRADGVPHTMGLVLTQPISPTPWTRPQNPLRANSSLTIRLLKKDTY